MPPADRDDDAAGADVPVDRLIISLRSYVTRKRKPGTDRYENNFTGSWPAKRISPQDWVLVFDCESRITPDEQLRFGTYQLRYRGHIWERGAFYDPSLPPPDLEVLTRAVAGERPGPVGEKICLITRQEFVERIFYGSAYCVGAQIVGFNLPYDLSRLAIDHDSARRSMKDGFSFVLHENKEYPRVVIKHLSQRASIIRFAGTGRWPDRGYFDDVKTLAAALLSGSYSLGSLSKTLNVPTPKSASDEHGGPLTPEYVRYAFNDTQATWECFDALSKRLASYGVANTGAYDLYSEASLGKKYLENMGVKPWMSVQPNFPPQIIGHILSAYYGGRSEVHIRRQITQVLHFDFLSMYPTVCTLMGLWRYVCAKGISYADDTEGVREFVRNCTPDTLKLQSVWPQLVVLVQVLPDRHIFPGRAAYGTSDTTTIGLNCLIADEPMWFTLPDVLASKFLTGKAPNISKAFRFTPLEAQDGLRPITIAGRTIDPAKDDFYKALIDHRRTIKRSIADTADAEKERLKAEEHAIKILANATSYGIFMELNVQRLPKTEEKMVYGPYDRPWPCKSDVYEKPGRYFHPLLGTLITGAARLMLSLAERQVVDQGLDWVFCDTDSIAIANVANVSPEEFKRRALNVQGWFSDLNPYEEKGPILQLEKVNFPPDGDCDLKDLSPPYCLAISAKRYVQFNRDESGDTVVRKASGHGLGHLIPPYDEPAEQRRERIARIGVPLWQEEFWRAIIRAADSEDPDQVILESRYDVPAASQYAATKPRQLDWFKAYNRGKPYADQIKPFNFLLSFYPKSRLQMALDDPAALAGPRWRKREPHPASPYFKDIKQAANHAFDRVQPVQPVPARWLKTVARSLARYHLHPEEKFIGGDFDQRGVLKRRHVHALAFQPIGKEADEIDEREALGEDEGPLERPFARRAQKQVMVFVDAVKRECKLGERDIRDAARVSDHTLANARKGIAVAPAALRRVASAAISLRDKFLNSQTETEELLAWARDAMIEVGGRNAFARLIDTDPTYLGRVLSGQKAASEELLAKFRAIGRFQPRE
jgi:hypothetical protein